MLSKKNFRMYSVSFKIKFVTTKMHSALSRVETLVNMILNLKQFFYLLNLVCKIVVSFQVIVLKQLDLLIKTVHKD